MKAEIDRLERIESSHYKIYKSGRRIKITRKEFDLIAQRSKCKRHFKKLFAEERNGVQR